MAMNISILSQVPQEIGYSITSPSIFQTIENHSIIQFLFDTKYLLFLPNRQRAKLVTQLLTKENREKAGILEKCEASWTVGCSRPSPPVGLSLEEHSF